MKRLDITMSDKDKIKVILTDFGATLDLSTAEADNTSVNNHAVIAIFFVMYNRQKVNYLNKTIGKNNDTIINN